MSPTPEAPAPKRPPRPLPVQLLLFVLKSALWAVPFALFFGTLSGARWPVYWLSLKISLVFSFCIRSGLKAVEHLLVRPLLARLGERRPHWTFEGAVYVTIAVAASYLSAYLVQITIYPGFARGPAAWLASGLFALLFATLFTGILYARGFYQQAAERAAQVERIRGELARAELRALRAQVNPHFLFNTLNTIASLIAENPRAAEDLTTRLADVFRYALTSARHEQARFADELEFLRTCLAIERVRFGNRLRIEESIEPGLDDVRVPSLLFQPIVENAVRYGVASRERGGTVRIEAAREGDALRVTVLDDGPGFEAGRAPNGHGVGLESVRERLRIAGEGHALAIDSAPGRGARITVTLPLSARAVDSKPLSHAPECVP